MKIYYFSILCLWWLALPIGAQQVRLVQIARDASNGAIVQAVSASEWKEAGMSYSSATAPSSWEGFHFSQWTNSRNAATKYRDPWGRSLNPISFVLLNDTTCTAHYLPTELDADGDDLPDWYEIEYFGDLGQDSLSDGDDDGRNLIQEYQSGTHPLYGNSQLAGGASYADSSLVTFNRVGYPSYTLRSVPAGTVSETDVVPPDTVITTPNLTHDSFGYWTLDGLPQRDAWGVALRQITFTMSSQSREAVVRRTPESGPGAKL